MWRASQSRCAYSSSSRPHPGSKEAQCKKKKTALPPCYACTSYIAKTYSLTKKTDKLPY